MIKPYNITFPLYAESDEEARALEADLKEFVKAKYNQKVYVRAARLSQLLKQHGGNIFINNFLR